MQRYDICVIGHLSNDVIVDADGRRRAACGGAAYYTSVALAHLGVQTLVTSVSAEPDRQRFRDELGRHGVTLHCAASPWTTGFENLYCKSGDRRIQRIHSIGRPFASSDLPDIECGLYHLGPLTPGEIPSACFEFLALRGARISLDLQGYVRRISSSVIEAAGWPAAGDTLRHVHTLKADHREAEAAANESDPVAAARRLARCGPQEVVVTCAGEGAILYANGDVFDIPPISVSHPVDPTGCGDSFCAGYLFARLQGHSASVAGRFASAVAAAKLRRAGPFDGALDEIEALLAL